MSATSCNSLNGPAGDAPLTGVLHPEVAIFGARKPLRLSSAM